MGYPLAARAPGGHGRRRRKIFPKYEKYLKDYYRELAKKTSERQ